MLRHNASLNFLYHSKRTSFFFQTKIQMKSDFYSLRLQNATHGDILSIGTDVENSVRYELMAEHQREIKELKNRKMF